LLVGVPGARQDGDIVLEDVAPVRLEVRRAGRFVIVCSARACGQDRGGGLEVFQRGFGRPFVRFGDGEIAFGKRRVSMLVA